ncbi:hypothetical protein EIP86_003544 [Pleurotus ostreatoroseus]|nr:hypothetical protein EIP86_003544 [Pleurotus ostreatoroseus]
MVTLIPSAPIALSRIPTEVIIEILEFASCDGDRELDTSLLKTSSLVCRDWSIVAQKLLFRHVSLRTDAGFASFQAAVNRSTPRSRTLADCVMRLDCVVDAKQPQGLTQAAFAKAVTMCPNLAELSLTLYGGPMPAVEGFADEPTKGVSTPLSEETTSLLRAGPQIRSLRFDNWSGDHSALWQLLDVWPSLTSLSLGGVHPSLPSPSQHAVRHAFTSIKLNFPTPPSADVMKALLHSSAHSLTALDIQREPSPELLQYLLTTHASSLTSLALPSCASPDRAAAVLQCTGLQALRIDSPGTLPSVLRGLPRTLQRLELAAAKDGAVPCLAQAVKSARALSKVTVHVGSDQERLPGLAAVRIACAVRGVELEVSRSASATRVAPQTPAPTYTPTFSYLESYKN